MRKFSIGQNVKIRLYGVVYSGKIVDTKYVGIFKQYGVEHDYDASVREDGSEIRMTIEWYSPYDIFNSFSEE